MKTEVDRAFRLFRAILTIKQKYLERGYSYVKIVNNNNSRASDFQQLLSK